MIYKNEQQLLKLIKYIPIIVLITITFSILIFLYFENISNFQKHKDELQQNYIIKSKALIKERIDNTYDYIKHMQETTEKELIDSLQEESHKVHSIISTIYNKYKDEKTEEEIKEIVKNVIKPLRFNKGRGYFFINERESYKNILHATMPHLEGVSLYDLQDAKGMYITRQMYKVLEHQDEGSLEWYWYKPDNEKKQYKKIGYVKIFKPLNWLIGTGEYVKDFKEQVQEKILERIRTTTYENEGYIFILDYNGKILSHYNKSLINKNALEIIRVKDDVKNIIYTARNNKNNGFVIYDHVKHPKSNKPNNKTSYVKAIDGWQWIIGTGFYKNDIQSVIEKKKKEYDKNILLHMKNTIIISIILALTLLILSLFLSNIVNRKIKAYKDEIKKHLNAQVEQQKILSHQAKMAAMGEMIGNIAHQWRQPLSSITSNATAMIVEKNMEVLDDKTLLEGLESINNKAGYLSKTIDDFRNFYNDDEDLSEFSINESIEETLSLIHSQLKQNQINIVKELEDVRIHNNKNKFIQVLINIINNAKDILIETNNDRFIFIDSKIEDKNIVLEITDTAGGIKDEIMNKIFDPYFTTKHQSQGTGIGLYMSNEIITQHMNGILQVSNKEFTHEGKKYKGASFKIIIPLS